MKQLIFLTLIFGGCIQPASPPDVQAERSLVLTDDGAWCWFQDPRAVYHEGAYRRTYTGWMTKSGQMQVGRYDHDSGDIESVTLKEEWDVDDHNTPAFLVLPDGRLMAFYARHNKVGLFARTTSNPEDISTWDPEVTVSNTDRITYSHPVQLSAEKNRIYVFWRGPSWKPTFTYSDDGETWSEPQILLQEIGREAQDIRPYLKVVSDGISTIHFTFTNGHPRVEPTNSVYYVKYEAGQFSRADGKEIGKMNSLPIDHNLSDLVYDATKGDARAWIWDIALDAAGQPVIVYTRLPEEKDHRYHYVRWNGSNWEDHFITKAGGWFPQTPEGDEEREVHYSGGISINQSNPSVVYFSRLVGDEFEIQKGTTRDKGQTWEIEAITSNSTFRNVRPVFPHGYPGDGDHVLWMAGQYIHYTEYDTAIRFLTTPPRGAGS